MNFKLFFFALIISLELDRRQLTLVEFDKICESSLIDLFYFRIK